MPDISTSKTLQVARALAEADGAIWSPDAQRYYLGVANTAIKAMENPSQAMITAGLQAESKVSHILPEDFRLGEIFNSMIGASNAD